MSSLKRVLLSITHLESGSTPLLNILDRNPRVQFLRSNPMIQNYMDLKVITSIPHKLDSVAAMHALDISFNYQLGPRTHVPHAHYLFIVRQPDHVLGKLIADKAYKQTDAAMYYCYRLRRICEIAKRVQQGMLLTFDDIRRGDHVAPLKSFLGLKEDVLHQPEVFESMQSSSVIDGNTLEWCRDCYERHLFFLKSLPLTKINL